MEPLVDVNIAVYNQAKFLNQTLDSVLAQITTFPFRLLVGDDCSNDGSIDIIKEYQSRFPDKVIGIFQPKNLGLKSFVTNGKLLLKSSTAKYIALLDGDDYWIDPYKLQKQVDFLEKNLEYSVVYHRVFYTNENNDLFEPESLNKSIEAKTYTIEDLANGNIIHTPSVIFRNNLKSIIPEWYSRVTAGDYVLHMLNSSEGKIYYFPEIMAVYRRHVGGVWSYKSEIDMLTEWLNMLKYLIEHFKNNLNVHKNLENQYANIAMRLSMLFEKNNDSINAIDYFRQSIILSNQVTEDFLKKFIELELKDNLSQNTISSKLINYYKHPERIIFLVKRLLKIKN
ncbi:MAG: glycosyltransferase [Sphingobacteriia bacterium]|jgi:glycosyltransferase involved in cell wall biosynthesis